MMLAEHEALQNHVLSSMCFNIINESEIKFLSFTSYVISQFSFYFNREKRWSNGTSFFSSRLNEYNRTKSIHLIFLLTLGAFEVKILMELKYTLE